jgi:hypothetical protein
LNDFWLVLTPVFGVTLPSLGDPAIHRILPGPVA